MNAHIRTPTPRRLAGFTVAELMVVGAILGILALIGLPAASMSNDRKLDMLQLQVQDAITHAQTLSYHSGTKHAVKFDVDGQWYAVLDEVGTPVQDPLTKGLYIIFLDRPDQPANIRLEEVVFGQRPLAAFDDKGKLTKSGYVRITADGQARELFMNTATAKFSEVPISE